MPLVSCCHAQKLQRIVASVPDLDRRDITRKENSADLPFDTAQRLGSHSRVIDAGSGTGALIPYLQVPQWSAWRIDSLMHAVSISAIYIVLAGPC